jgi:cyclopropane fatty-acyl-phospholipid synthase-like methyltransferase
MQEWFAEWFDSPYYHLLYQHRSDDEAGLFIEALLSKIPQKPGNTVLDLACGKGRHSRALALHQLDVTGVDLSLNSIREAAQYETDRLHFFVHDMRQTYRANYYDLVCNLFTSFGYFKTSHDNWLAARSMYLAAKKGGKLLIDFVNKAHAEKAIESNPEETIWRDKIRFDISRFYTINRLIKQIRISDESKTLIFEESLNSFTPQEMINLFNSTGLKFETMYGNYQMEEYHEKESPRMIMVFVK